MGIIGFRCCHEFRAREQITMIESHYGQTSNISRTKFRNLNYRCDGILCLSQITPQSGCLELPSTNLQSQEWLTVKYVVTCSPHLIHQHQSLIVQVNDVYNLNVIATVLLYPSYCDRSTTPYLSGCSTCSGAMVRLDESGEWVLQQNW